jgi:hypothetical protein
MADAVVFVVFIVFLFMPLLLFFGKKFAGLWQMV